MKKVHRISEGCKFGKLTVLQPISKPEYQGEFWLCQCSCGDISTYSKDYLVDDSNAFKGCRDCEKLYDDPNIGRIFGDFKVMSRFHDSRPGKRYKCICTQCGAERIYNKASFKNNSKCKVHNYAYSYSLISKDTAQMKFLYKGEAVEAIFDAEDLAEAEKHNWYIALNNEYYYAYTSIQGKIVSLAQFVLMTHNLYDRNLRMLILNKNTLDCRKENLVMMSTSGCAAYRKTPKSNKSGRKGVQYINKYVTKPWHAVITFKHKVYNLGYYETFDEAVKAREQGEEKFFGFICDEETSSRYR